MKRDTVDWRKIFLQDLLKKKKVIVLDDFDQSFAAMLSIMNERSSDIINRRYRYGEQYVEIGEKYNICIERVRAIISNSLRRIRGCEVVAYFTKGYEFTKLVNEVDEKLENNDRELVWLCQVKDKLDELETLKKKPVKAINIDENIKDAMVNCNYKLVENLLNMDLQLLVEELWNCDMDVSSLSKKNVDIDEMGFSPTTYNVLYRHGIRNLRDLVKMSRSDFERVRYLGVRRMEEIERVLSKYDIQIKE